MAVGLGSGRRNCDPRPGWHWPFITWGPPVPPKVTKNRLHLDIAPPSKDDLPVEVDRLIFLGASHADTGQGDGYKVVMLDPDGNEFCVLTPW
jgi:hypothetical protein